MKIELLVTLKSDKLWRKGLIFDSKDGPIPQGILREVEVGSRTVKVLESDGVAEKSPIAAPETVNEKSEVVETPEIHDLPQGFVDENLKEIEDQEDPLRPAKEIETKDQSSIPKEKPSVPKPAGSILSDLEELIKIKGSVAETVRLLKVSYPTVVRWRKGESKPQDKMLKLIKKKLRELKDDQSRDDSDSSAGSEGTVNEPEH